MCNNQYYIPEQDPSETLDRKQKHGHSSKLSEVAVVIASISQRFCLP